MATLEREACTPPDAGYDEAGRIEAPSPSFVPGIESGPPVAVGFGPERRESSTALKSACAPITARTSGSGESAALTSATLLYFVLHGDPEPTP